MAKFIKKPIEVNAISFDEFVQYGLNADGANIVEGQPWHFSYEGHPVTQENATVYLIPTKEGVMRFTPNDVLITGIQGEIYPCKKDIFEATYDSIAKQSDLTFEEAEKWLKKDLCIALPEWTGFWFKNIKTGETLVLTKDGEIVDTPHEIYKERSDWKVVKATDDQLKIISDYINEPDLPLKLVNDLTFGNAIEALKQGFLVSRKGWNGKGMFIVKQIPSVIGVDIIPRMQSLPESVKNVFVEREQPIRYESQMLIIKSDGSADSWVPSSSDCFAEDWIIVK